MPINEPQITRGISHEASIEEYIKDVKIIWPLNSKRSPLHIWMEAVGRAATVCEGVRKLEWDIVIDELAALIMWWFAFIGRANDLNKSSGDFTLFRLPNKAGDILWRNYPRCCPVCISTLIQTNPKYDLEQLPFTTCNCLISKKSAEERSEEVKQLAANSVKRLSQIRHKENPKSLFKFAEMFATLYQPNIYSLSPEEISFHLLEEVGEVSDALVDATIHRKSKLLPYPSNPTKKNLDAFIKEAKVKIDHIEKELADVFSWSISLLEKSKLIISSASRLCNKFNEEIIDNEVLNKLLETLNLPTQSLSIVDIIWRKYELNGKLGHRLCNSNICKCFEGGQLLIEGQHLPDNVIDALLSI